MSTNINVTFGGNQLVDKSKAAQQANRVQFIESSQEKAVEKETTEKVSAQIAARQLGREGAIPEYGVVDQTSAQRGGDVIAGLNGGFVVRQNLYDTRDRFVFNVVDPVYPPVPGTQTSIDWQSKVPSVGPDYEPIPYPLYNTSLTLVEDNGGTAAGDWYCPNGAQADSSGSCGSYSGGARTPASRKYTQTTWIRDTLNTYKKSKFFVLPVGKDSGIVVYYTKWAGYHNVWREDYELLINSSVTATSGNLTGFTQVSQNIYTQTMAYENVWFDSEIICFVYNKKALRVITAPAQLVSKIDQIMPDYQYVYYPQAIGTRNSTQTTTPVILSGPVYTTDLQTTYPNGNVAPQNLTGSIIEFAGVYNYTPSIEVANTFLATHFGIGQLHINSHGAGWNFNQEPYWTPAVYTYLKGEMNLQTSESQNYAYMRANYFPNAPRRYINLTIEGDIWYQNTNPDKYAITRQEPISITTPMPYTNFKTVNKGTQGVGYYPQTKGISAWDWGNSQFCKAQLLALGFSNADLTP